MRQRLEGVGEAEHTTLEVREGEYFTRVPRYGMVAHTFTQELVATREKFFAAQCRRMQFLRAKLLEDIATGGKIFVYGSPELTDEFIEALYRALRGLGPNATLLCVRAADAQHPVNVVHKLADGLLVGAATKFATFDPAYDDWLQAFRLAAEIVDAKKSPPLTASSLG